MFLLVEISCGRKRLLKDIIYKWKKIKYLFFIFFFMATNPAIIEVNENQEDLKKKIKALPLNIKLKAVALNYYL